MVQSIARAQSNGRADLVTYRHNGKLVYVPPAETYEKALDCAIHAYPNLANERREQIYFGIGVVVSGRQDRVRISKLAWPAISGSLERFEIIDVDIDSSIPPAEKSEPVSDYGAPPQYVQDGQQAILCPTCVARLHDAPSGTASAGATRKLSDWFSSKRTQ